MDDFQKNQNEKRVFEAMFGSEGPAETTLDEFTTNHLYKEIWTRPLLGIPERSMLTIAILAALGRDRELARHIEGALNIGTSRARINEMMIHVAHYAGWPAGHNGQCIALEQYQQNPTSQQLQILKEHNHDIPKDLTRGEASDLLATLCPS
ncbi:MAG: carboxymuconolactone decarboxylase family protein [Acidobacteriota bacterium]|nr:carboxymuconolactone decarboxylase family protein [Acidobacteriota bacterium]